MRVMVVEKTQDARFLLFWLLVFVIAFFGVCLVGFRFSEFWDWPDRD